MEEKKKAERVKKSKQEVRAYRNEWAKENLDRFNFSMSKGKKEEIRAHAAKMGESTNALQCSGKITAPAWTGTTAFRASRSDRIGTGRDCADRSGD